MEMEEHVMSLSIEDIRAIAAVKHGIDMSESAISSEMIQVCINTLNSDHMTKEEQALGYFTRKRLKRLETWQEWKDGETKQLDQFFRQKMFGDAIDPLTLTEVPVVLRPHWQYSVKRSGVRRSRMCCDGSKRAAPQLHAVASTWSSCVELPVQRIFLGIAADLNLTIYGGDATDAYAHSPAPNDTYLAIDDAYADWYKDRFGEEIDRQYILPVKHCLRGHPESGKMWMHFIDNILIKEMGFKTTTHD